jgi:hypothetical protein
MTDKVEKAIVYATLDSDTGALSHVGVHPPVWRLVDSVRHIPWAYLKN